MSHSLTGLLLAILVSAGAFGDSSPPAEPAAPVRAEPAAKDVAELHTARSRVTAVTVYRGNALVTREVDLPAEKGHVEVVVTPLPAQTIDSSLYTEGTDGIRVLSTRFRSRAVKQDTREEVRAKEEEIKKLQAEAQRLQKEIQVNEQNLQMLSKLENFTAATMQHLTEKGVLNDETTIALSKYVMDTRAEKSNAQVDVQLRLQANADATAFATRELGELTAGASHMERDAVIVVDKVQDGPGRVRLNYLVGASTWTPQYRLRAGKEKDPIQLEYLAAIEQQSGEDWNGVDVVLSTAQPMLNAAPPDLLALDVSVIGSAPASGAAPLQAGMAGPILGAQNFAMSRSLRQKAQQELITNNLKQGGAYINEAAALEQTEELLAKRDEFDTGKTVSADVNQEGPSVTYHLRSKLTIPSRTDQQLIEVTRIEMSPDYYYKAVPVLTPHVYRLATLANKSEYVLLPGEATMYVGLDFVGRMSLPLVAIGEAFTVGFGVDPQLQVSRQLVKTSRNVQGGNQVHSYEYRIAINSYKSSPVSLQVWDRMPHAEAESLAVTLVEPTPKLSTDPSYLRKERPDNLLRWDLTVQPGTNGEKAETIAYQFKLEYARDVAISSFKAKQ